MYNYFTFSVKAKIKKKPKRSCTVIKLYCKIIVLKTEVYKTRIWEGRGKNASFVRLKIMICSYEWHRPIYTYADIKYTWHGDSKGLKKKKIVFTERFPIKWGQHIHEHAYTLHFPFNFLSSNTKAKYFLSFY